MEPERIRTFIAVEIPDQIKEQIERMQRGLRGLAGDVSWVRPASIHLTVRFLGEISLDLLGAICESVTACAASHPPFTLEARGVGCFPSERKPRVLWVGIEDASGALAEIHSRLEEALSRLGFDRENRAFSPHLTLGRMRSAQSGAVMASRLKATGFDAHPFRVTRIVVMRSDLGPKGAKHTPQAVCPLRGSG
ncbi:MAG: RNA 2',3'-cyclic phosphodiesterase [Acidobacteriota bacterium]